jgi:hypothetical protein
VTPLTKKNKIPREGVDIRGVKVPVVYISIFCLILGFGGYVSPLLLLSATLLYTSDILKSLPPTEFVKSNMLKSLCIEDTDKIKLTIVTARASNRFEIVFFFLIAISRDTGNHTNIH